MNNIQSRIFTDFALETTAKDAQLLLKARPNIPENTQVKIAFLGNENFKQRLSAIEMLRACNINPMPIISARRLESSSVLNSYLRQAIRIGRIDSIFLVGGDPSVPKGPFSNSVDIIKSNILSKFDINTVGVAGYPEGHPIISNEELWIYLKKKIYELMSRGFSVEITTQLSFDIEQVISWIEQVRREGINVPIRVGIPSPSTVAGLLKFASQCRVATSLRLLNHYGFKVSSLLGSVGPERFLKALVNAVEHRGLGDIRLHVFPMGNLSTVMKWTQDDLRITA